MRTLVPALLAALVSLAFGSLEYSQDAGGSIITWEPVEGAYTSLVIRASDMACDLEDPDWGVIIAEVMPDEEGVFPASVQLPAAFIVDPDKCISDEICVAQCPTAAISLDSEGKAVIEAEACIACGICAAVCPVNAIFAPNAGMHYGLYGVNEEGMEEFLQGTEL